MKKLLLAVFVLASTTTMAQLNMGKTQFGLTFSPSAAWMGSKENNVDKDGGKFGFNYGFIADIAFDDNYYFGTGLMISQTGGSLKYKPGSGYAPNGSLPTTDATYDFKLQHVMIPLTLKLKTNPINKLNYWGQFGSYIAIKTGARLSDGGQNLDREKISKVMQPLNMGLLLGAGVEFALEGKTRGMAGINFENGFIDATRNGKWNNDGKMVINNLVLRVGVFF